jgi:hypothetical protein
MDNTSGQGKSAIVPAEVNRWNWGAFLLNWIWGIGNDTYIALLMFVPGVNFVMLFVLGAKGSAWAWRNRRWTDIAQFKRVQRKWAIWGVVVWVGVIGFYATFAVSFYWVFRHSVAYEMAVARLATNPAAISALGTPISTGFPWGHISVSGPSGHAELSFSAQGPKADGTVYVNATKALGTWRIDRIELEINGRDRRINLGNGPTGISY